MEIMGTTDFVSGALEGTKRLGGGELASISKLLTVRLTLACDLSLSTKRRRTALARDICSELTDVGIKGAKSGVARIIGGLIGHTESKDNLPDLPLVDKSPQLRTKLQLIIF